MGCWFLFFYKFIGVMHLYKSKGLVYHKWKSFFVLIGNQNQFIKGNARKAFQSIQDVYKETPQGNTKTKRDTNYNPLSLNPTTPQSLQRKEDEEPCIDCTKPKDYKQRRISTLELTAPHCQTPYYFFPSKVLFMTMFMYFFNCQLPPIPRSLKFSSFSCFW